MANFSSISISSSSSSSRVGFCDNNAHPSSLAFLCLGLSNFNSDCTEFGVENFIYT